MKRNFFAFFMAGVVWSMLLSCQTPQKPFDRGMSFFYQQNYTSAIEAFAQAFSENDRPIEAAIMHATSLQEGEEYQEALTVCEKALARFPDSLALWVEQMRVARALTNESLLALCRTNIQRLSPQNAWDYRALGFFYKTFEKNSPQALDAYSKAIEKDPQFALAYIDRGDLYYDLDQENNAIQDYTQAIKISPHYAYAYYSRGNAYLNRKQYRQALKDFNKAIKINPRYALAYHDRGVIYYRLKKYAKARAEWLKAKELDPHGRAGELAEGNLLLLP